MLTPVFATVSFSVGPRAEFCPYDRDFRNLDDYRDSESYVFGLEGSLETSWFALDLDVGIHDMVATTTYPCLLMRFSESFALKIGAGLNLEFSGREYDGKPVVTSGGLLFKRFSFINKYQKELLLRTFRVKAALEVKMGFLTLQADYIVVPHYLHSIFADEKGFAAMVCAGILGVSLKIGI